MKTLTTALAISLSFIICRTDLVAQTPEAEAPPPNVIIILADDAGYADFGFTGSKQFPTPHIDSLAAQGTTFTQAYVTASVCSPSRAGLLTGRYQQRFGHEMNLAPNISSKGQGLDLQEKTIADHFKNQGYRTAAIGKWHLGSTNPFHPLNRGFDQFHGFLGGGRSFFALDPAKASEHQKLRNGFDPIEEPEDLYLTDWCADRAIDFIKETPDNDDDEVAQPFFLYVAFNAVHTPMHATEKDLAAFPHIKKPGRQKLAAMTHALDRAVGNILNTLQENKLDDNTIVVFLNDNGGATTNHSDNGPWRGMKGSKWEGGIRVPLIIRWPNELQPNTTFNHPITTLDLTPTLLSNHKNTLIDYPTNLDGTNLLPYLQGKITRPPHLALFWRRSVAAAVLATPWKLIRVQDNPTILINLENDPGETTNRADENPEMVAQLLQLLTAWESQMIEPAWDTGKIWRQNQIKKHDMNVQGRAAERKIP